MRRLVWLSFLLLLSLNNFSSPGQAGLPADMADFTFAVAADMRYFTGQGSYDSSQYFRGAVQAMVGTGIPAFLVSPGDIDPPVQTRWTLDQVLGSDFRWLPVVGNHELPGAGTESSTGANLAWLRAYANGLGAVHPGPAGCPTTTFSFDYQNAHFSVLNEYCDTAGDTLTEGDIPDHLYSWLAADLAATDRPLKFVIGHEPAFPLPDQDNGRLRHETDSLNQYPAHRDRFWNLLRAQYVAAYLCGHTHNASAVYLDGVWQIDAGHARGLGDTGAASTFVLVQVRGSSATYQMYRDDANGGAYALRHSGLLVGEYHQYLPAVRGAAEVENLTTAPQGGDEASESRSPRSKKEEKWFFLNAGWGKNVFSNYGGDIGLRW
jgi:hypothetical protein